MGSPRRTLWQWQKSPLPRHFITPRRSSRRSVFGRSLECQCAVSCRIIAAASMTPQCSISLPYNSSAKYDRREILSRAKSRRL